jgi:hypothetical protein
MNKINMQNFYYVDNLIKNNDIKIQNVTSAISIKKFNNFEIIKSNLTTLITEEKNFKKEQNVINEIINVSRSDYHNALDFERKWIQYIFEDLKNNILFLCNSLGFYGFRFNGIWFQQYNSNSYHGWHLHQGSNYSGVFYIELPTESPKTEFLDTLTNKKFFLEMHEGDIAIFPAYLPHRSGKNESNKTKTIVSFNLDFALPDLAQEKISLL